MKIGNLEVYGIIYKIQNKINGKCYIGQTTQKGGFKDRYGNNIENNTHNEHLRRSIKKYGIDNFTINETLDIAFNQQELNIKEKCWISIYDSFKNGYNQSIGGHVGNIREGKTKEELKIWQNKIANSNRGKKRSDEIKKRMSIVRIGKNTGSEHVLARKVICLNNKKIFDTVTEASIYGNSSPTLISACCGKTRKHSGILEGKRLSWMYYDEYLKLSQKEIEYIELNLDIGSYTRVICITTNKIFNSVKEGADYYKCNNSNIINCCKGIIKSTGKLKDGTKLIWRYYEDYFKMTNKEIELLIFEVNSSTSPSPEPIICIETRIVYKSSIDASKNMNIKVQSISNHLNGRSKATHGFHLKRISDLSNEEYINYDIDNKLKKFKLCV